MKIIVLSDSHGDTATIESIASLPADAMIHCGDSELSADHPALNGLHTVRGNCDRDSRLPVAVTITVGNNKILAVHGHEHGVKQSLLGLSYAAEEEQAKIVLFGHSHIYGAEMQDGVLFVNPGSTVQPRGGRPATYAVIEWDNRCSVSFYNMQHELVDQAIFMK